MPATPKGQTDLVRGFGTFFIGGGSLVCIAVLMVTVLGKEACGGSEIITAADMASAQPAGHPPPRTEPQPPRPQRTRGLSAADKTQLDRFVAWAAKHRADASRAAQNPECSAAGELDAGWCYANKYLPNNTMFTAQYWKANPRAARFEFGGAPKGLGCNHFGMLKQIGEKKPTGGGLGIVSCEFVGGELIGMKLVINTSGSYVHAFLLTADYMKRDTKFKVRW